jgi:hypothetical protein
MSLPTLKVAGYFAGLAYFYGLLLGGFTLVWQVLFRDGLPSLAWWQWLLAPLAIGCAAMGAEWLFEKLQSTTGFGIYGENRVKRALHLLILFVVLAGLIIAPAIYKVASP